MIKTQKITTAKIKTVKVKSLKKKAKKGTYKVKITAAASGDYKAATKTISIKVK